MTKQEIFDIAAKHLLTQNARAEAITPDGSYQCKYRAPNGHKCAVGVLISDEEYKPEMEGASARSLLRNFPELSLAKTLAKMPEHEQVFTENVISALQSCHDTWTPEYWRGRLTKIAETYGLSTAALDA